MTAYDIAAQIVDAAERQDVTVEEMLKFYQLAPELDRAVRAEIGGILAARRKPAPAPKPAPPTIHFPAPPKVRSESAKRALRAADRRDE